MKNPLKRLKQPFYKSKTLWVNLLMAAGIILNEHAGQFNITPETQALGVMAVNFLLRKLTTKPLGK